MNIFPVSHLPMSCYFLKFLTVTFFVFVFYVETLASLLMPIGKLHFQISNCNVFIFVTLAFVIMVSNCIPSKRRKAVPFEILEKYSFLTVKSALLIFASSLSKHLSLQDRVVQPINANPRLKVNRGFHLARLKWV